MDIFFNFIYSVRFVLLVASGILCIVYLILYFLEYFRQTFYQSNRNRTLSHSYRPHSENSELKQKLLRLLNGDVDAAKRLLKQQKQLHQGKSETWYLEKVIFDLERDRRW